MKADVLINKKLNPVVTELFIGGRKLKIYYAILFYYTKNIRLNSMHYFIMRVPSKWELQQIASSHSSNIDFKGIIIWKNW